MADPPRHRLETLGSGCEDEPHPRPDIGPPVQLAGSGALDRLVETARGYAAQAAADATRRAYAADWARSGGRASLKSLHESDRSGNSLEK